MANAHQLWREAAQYISFTCSQGLINEEVVLGLAEQFQAWGWLCQAAEGETGRLRGKRSYKKGADAVSSVIPEGRFCCMLCLCPGGGRNHKGVLMVYGNWGWFLSSLQSSGCEVVLCFLPVFCSPILNREQSFSFSCSYLLQVTTLWCVWSVWC